MFDTIIIGMGPAGLTAATYLSRYNHKVLMIGKDFGALKESDLIDNYFGFAEPIEGRKLVENGLIQAKRHGTELRHDVVISIIEENGVFTVSTDSETFMSKSVLFATGKNRKSVPVKGFHEFRGRGISLCATCDAYFFKGKKIALIGDGPYMLHELNILKNLTDDITVFTNGKELDLKDFPVITDQIIEFSGDKRVNFLHTLKDKYEVDGIFVALGSPSSIEFAQALGIILDNDDLVVDKNYQTNIPGVFAAGDVIGGFLQISKAVYDGANAARFIHKFLRNESV